MEASGTAAMKPGIVSVLGRSGGTWVFVGSGALLSRVHVLTAAHVWDDATKGDDRCGIGLLAGRHEPVHATLLGRFDGRDAAILRLVDWEADDGEPAPSMQVEFVGLHEQPVSVHAVSPVSKNVSRASSFSVSTYDSANRAYELMPHVARGNSGGVITHGDRLAGLIVQRAVDDPIARALAMHSLVPWITRVTGVAAGGAATPPTTAVAPRRRAPVVPPPPGKPGVSHRLGSIHLHVDGAHAEHVVDHIVESHRNDGFLAEIAAVTEAWRGPQRDHRRREYDLHTPGPPGDEQLDFFSTTQFHAGPDTPDAPCRRNIALAVHNVLNELSALGNDVQHVVIEVERVVGAVDDNGQVEMVSMQSLSEQPGAIESLLGLQVFAPFNTRDVRSPGSAGFELHFSLDIHPRVGNEPPVELAYLGDLTRRAGIAIGGWFLFSDDSRWAYRSNAFMPTTSATNLKQQWSALRRHLDADLNPLLQKARLRLLAEETIGVWKTPLMMASDDMLTVHQLANWESGVDGLTEFWVSLPNFLGDQSPLVEEAMRRNFDNGVRYVYFLRSDADAKRWLDFRRRMQEKNPLAEALMTAYVVGFRNASGWDHAAAFIANPRDPVARSGYSLRIDTGTNRVLAGIRLPPLRLRELVETLSPVLGGGAITHWHLVRPDGEDVRVVAVCVNLFEMPSEELFERLDSRLALLASTTNGEVALYGNKSITVIFEGQRRGVERALIFAQRVLVECASLPDPAPVTLRVGLDFGDARQVMRACGPLWVGPAVRACRSVLYEAPARNGLFLTAGTSTPQIRRQCEAVFDVEDLAGCLACWPRRQT